MVEVVNMVGTGDFGREVDIEALSSDLQELEAQYEPQSYPALRMRFGENSGVMMLFRTGKYVVMGVESEEQLYDLLTRIVDVLKCYITLEDSINPEIVNISCRASLDEDIDFDKLMIQLGMENVEYEPEQNPFLVYRPEEHGCTITVASSGEAVIAGTTIKRAAVEAFEDLKNEVKQLHNL